MKKTYTISILIFVLISLLGCKQSCKHEKQILKYDLQYHWHECESCKGKISMEAHNGSEEEPCEVCNSIIYLEESGGVLMHYDEQGSLHRMIYYDEENKISDDFVYDYEYYEDGNVKSLKSYYNDFLESEEVYLPCVDPEAGVYLASITYYFEDGSKSVDEYNEDLNLLTSITYDDNGKIIQENIYTYENVEDENGNIVKMIQYVNGKIYSETFYSYGEDGERVENDYIIYDEDENPLP